jgi:hypothetical protein
MFSKHDPETTSPYESESCPLLRDSAAVESLQPAPTPVPKIQLATACFLRLLDPIAFTQVFPYINEFMSNLHVTDDPSKIGFYSGVVVCICVALLWVDV